MRHSFIVYTKKTYSRKKTNIKHIHRRFLSGSKSFGENLGCPYYKGDGLQHDHDPFIVYEFAIEKKEVHMKAIIEKLNVLLTPKAIYEGIYRGETNYYNNTTRK